MKRVKKGKRCPLCRRYYDRSPTCSALLLEDEKVLLVKRAKNMRMGGYWAFPGGYLDWDETCEECVLRELKEETGVMGKVIKLIGVYSDPARDEDGRQNVDVLFLIKYIEKASDFDREEVEKLGWFSKNSLPSEIAFDHRKIILDYFENQDKLEENRRPLIGVGVIVKKGSKILLLKRKGSHGLGEWALPGGYQELGESLKECAVREVEEETGLRIDEDKLRFISLSEQMDYLESDGKHCVTAGFWIEYYGEKKPKLKEKEKSFLLDWFDLDNLPLPLFAPTRDNIGNYKKMVSREKKR